MICFSFYTVHIYGANCPQLSGVSRRPRRVAAVSRKRCLCMMHVEFFKAASPFPQGGHRANDFIYQPANNVYNLG